MAKAGFWDKKLSTVENIVCAWPLVLIGVGGALGGLCGACGWYLNVKVMKSDYIGLVTYPAVILIGLASWASYLGIVVWLVIQFPEIFAL